MSHNSVSRFGQPLTGIISFFVFLALALVSWFIFSDPRGLVKLFPYPFVMYLAVMILVGLWQHMLFGDWPFHKLKQPVKGIVMTVMNLLLTLFVIHVVFYRILGLGFNFLSQSNIDSLIASGKSFVIAGKSMSLEGLKTSHMAERALVSFVLIGFFTYPVITILFGKWPIRPSNLEQPQAGTAELGWTSLVTLFFFVPFIVPFWGYIYSEVYGASIGMGTPWWGKINGTAHLHWVFGWWEWSIIALFMTANVWRGKPWSLIKIGQPLKGLISLIGVFAIGYLMAIICVKLAPLWIGSDTISALKSKGEAEYIRFLWYHAAEIAGFTLIPFLIWHHYFEDRSPVKDADSWSAFAFRTAGVLLAAAVLYIIYYYGNFGKWALGNSHMTSMPNRFIHGESLIWNFWWIIPLLWNDWFFAKWGLFKEQPGNESH